MHAVQHYGYAICNVFRTFQYFAEYCVSAFSSELKRLFSNSNSSLGWSEKLSSRGLNTQLLHTYTRSVLIKLLQVTGAGQKQLEHSMR